MLKILQLEDRQEDALLTEHAIVREGGIPARFTVVKDRFGFIAALDQGPFDLILADHGLPGFDGLEALKMARQRFPQTGFICLSGSTNPDDIQSSLAAGATDFVHKDEPGRLIAAVRREQEKCQLLKMNRGMSRLVKAVQELSLARDLDTIMAIVRRAARELTGADGATFVLRDGDRCYYADEDAIEPLWKGQRFPLSACISGWAMLNRQPAVIEDIYSDSRIPAAAYRPTFVKSLAMVPIRTEDPVAAIGNYWATRRMPTKEEVELLQALANTTSVAMENVAVYNELEQRVKDRTVQLEKANDELDSFAHAVSHDLGAPLRHIQAFSEMAIQEAGPALNETSRGYLATVQNGAKKMRALMDDLLRLSKVSRAELRKQKVDLSRLAHEIIKPLSADAPQRKVDIRITEGMVAEGDYGLLRIVLENLLSNAWKYTAKKEIARIEFAPVSKPDGSRAFCVRDNGAGFNMEYAGQLFQPFTRLHNEEDFKGTGIGLTTVQRIIHRHGGTIWAEAEEDKGAAFYFSLPS